MKAETTPVDTIEKFKIEIIGNGSATCKSCSTHHAADITP
jgi:hypothetical protein